MKIDLFRRRADRDGDLATRRFDGGVGLPAEGVRPARRVAVVLAEIRQHRLENARIDWRAGVEIEIDGERQGHLQLPGYPGSPVPVQRG